MVKNMAEKRARLSSEDWIMAGFRALARDGSRALKAEPLARELNTTKGSFYWHFKDLTDFHTRMLALWEDRAVDTAIDELASEPDPVRRLHLLGEIATAKDMSHGGDSTEPAMRAWALEHPEVAKAVARVDQKRLSYLEQILAELDLTNPDFARIIYGAYIGLGALSATDEMDNRSAMSTLLAALLALRDA